MEQYFKSFQRVGDKFENSSVQSLMKLLAKVANKCWMKLINECKWMKVVYQKMASEMHIAVLDQHRGYFHPLSSNFINFIHFHPCHPCSSTFIHFRSLSSTFNHFSIFIHFESGWKWAKVDESFIKFHILSPTFIHVHPLSSILPWAGNFFLKNQDITLNSGPCEPTPRVLNSWFFMTNYMCIFTKSLGLLTPFIHTLGQSPEKTIFWRLPWVEG